MLPVRDQGSQGSCAAMAGAAMKEWQESVDVALSEYMSPQFIYNNREDVNIEGMYMRDLMSILLKLGDCRELTYAYGTLSKIPTAAFAEALKYVIKGYAAVNTVAELKTALYLHGPCIMAVPVYNFGDRMWVKGPGEYLLGGHGLCVVGYDDNAQHFIIRNSWADEWGDNGYCYFPYTDWGCQWEVWSTVDADSKDQPVPPTPGPVPTDDRTWFSRFWWVIALGAAALTTALILIFK